jgi:hypothetical protein
MHSPRKQGFLPGGIAGVCNEARILFLRLLGEHRSGLGEIRRLPEKVTGQARLIGMRNTRTLEVGERVTISHGGRHTSEGMVTDNNPASSLIYVDGYACERYKVEGRITHDPAVCPNYALTLVTEI